jgi:hypothetical protein
MNNRNFFLTLVVAEKFTIKVLSGSVSVESPLSGFEVVSSYGRKGQIALGVSLIRALTPSMRAQPHSFITSQRLQL